MSLPTVLHTFEDYTFTLLLNTPRMASAFLMIPFFSRQVLPGAIFKNAVIMSLGMFLVPLHLDIAQNLEFYSVNMLGLLMKEIFIGVVIGFVTTIPFWAIEGVGFFIDNQRGATMASSINPLTGSQTSPLGLLLNQTMTTIFFAGMSFLLFLEGLYTSYLVWPLISYYPSISLDVMDFFIDQLAYLLLLTVLLASPIIIVMFMTEFCFALINRFTPQLNVFILSMPVKSVVALFVMLFYLQGLFYYLAEEIGDVASVFQQVKAVLNLEAPASP